MNVDFIGVLLCAKVRNLEAEQQQQQRTVKHEQVLITIASGIFSAWNRFLILNADLDPGPGRLRTAKIRVK
jgi:hypothetical protein